MWKAYLNAKIGDHYMGQRPNTGAKLNFEGGADDSATTHLGNCNNHNL